MATMYLRKVQVLASCKSGNGSFMSPTRHERLGKLVCSSSRVRHGYKARQGKDLLLPTIGFLVFNNVGAIVHGVSICVLRLYSKS